MTVVSSQYLWRQDAAVSWHHIAAGMAGKLEQLEHSGTMEKSGKLEQLQHTGTTGMAETPWNKWNTLEQLEQLEHSRTF